MYVFGRQDKREEGEGEGEREGKGGRGVWAQAIEQDETASSDSVRSCIRK